MLKSILTVSLFTTVASRDLDPGPTRVPMSTLRSESLLATVVKSDTVRIDFSMTALDYLRSKERNVNIGYPSTTIHSESPSPLSITVLLPISGPVSTKRRSATLSGRTT